MQKMKWIAWLAGGLILAACGRQATAPVEAPADAPTEAPPPTAAATATAAPTSTPVAQSPVAAQSAAAAPVSPLPTVTQAATQAPGATPAGADDASFAVPDWFAFAETYTNEQVGFALRYPADWNLLDVAPDVRDNSTNYAVTINSWETDEGGSGGIPAGQTKLDILVMRSDAATVEEAAAQRRAELTENEPDIQIVDEEMWELESGLQAQRWTIQGQQADSYEVIAVFDGWTVILAGLGDEQRFEEIARTLRPIAE